MPSGGKIDRIEPGRRFDMLTVVSDTGKTSGRYKLWHCACDCGGEVDVSTRDLKCGKVRSCGCAAGVKPGVRDLTGMRFGKLQVLNPTDKRMDQGSVVWHCKCDCGNECEVSSRRLVRGKVRSCGCLSNPLRKDYVGKIFGRWTVMEYAGTAKDLGLAGTENYWKCKCFCGNEGIVGQTELQNGESGSCGCLQKERLLESLKLVDGTSIVRLETARGKLSANNASGKTGVCYFSREQKWAAYITLQKKRYRLGLYKDKEEAIRVRVAAEEMHEDVIDWYYQEYLPGRTVHGEKSKVCNAPE